MNSIPNAADTFLLPALPEGLSLDFANTRYWRGREMPTETFHAIDDVLAWCESTGGVPAEMVQAYRAAHLHDENDARTALGVALELREALYQLYGANARGTEPSAQHLATLLQFLHCAAPRDKLVRIEGGYRWALDARRCELEDVLSPVLWSASNLLGGAGLEKVKQCANEECRWLFLDDSKSGNRRWCSMSSCGNRAKARRHYHKHSTG